MGFAGEGGAADIDNELKSPGEDPKE